MKVNRKKTQIDSAKKAVYEFLWDSHTEYQRRRSVADLSPSQFVTAVGEHGIRKFGRLMDMVFEAWKITSPQDIGNLIDEMVKKGFPWKWDKEKDSPKEFLDPDNIYFFSLYLNPSIYFKSGAQKSTKKLWKWRDISLTIKYKVNGLEIKE